MINRYDGIVGEFLMLGQLPAPVWNYLSPDSPFLNECIRSAATWMGKLVFLSDIAIDVFKTMYYTACIRTEISCPALSAGSHSGIKIPFIKTK